MGPEIRTAVRKRLLKGSESVGESGKGVVDFKKALYELENNPTYKQLLRESDYASLRDELSQSISAVEPSQKAADALRLKEGLAKDSPEQILNKILKEYHETDMADVAGMLNATEKTQLQRASLEKLLRDSIGEQDIVNAPKFAQEFRRHRDVLEAAGTPESKLKAFDAIADELKKYTLSIEHSRGAQWGGIAESGIMTSGATGAAVDVLRGRPEIGALKVGGSTAALLTPKFMLNIFLQPEGPHVFARWLASGQKTGPLMNKLIDMAGMTGVAAGTAGKAAPFVKQKQEE
jgi:hypothetical protein